MSHGPSPTTTRCFSIGSRSRTAAEPRAELVLEHRRHDIGVVVQVDELVLDVAVVHVDRNGAQLVRREHRLDELDAVVRVDRDVLTLTDAVRREVVRQPVRPLLQLARR